MLYWSALYFVIALAAAVIGFSGMAADHGGNIARILFFVFMILSMFSFVFARRAS